jgi:hypothetical protein
MTAKHEDAHISALGPLDARHLIRDLRALDPALRALIDARIACEVCANPRHELHGAPHGDACQRWPYADADKYADACTDAEAARSALAAAEDLLSALATAAGTFAERESLSDADADAFEATIVEPLREFFHEPEPLDSGGIP